jgi:uncharacterized protein YegL
MEARGALLPMYVVVDESGLQGSRRSEIPRGLVTLYEHLRAEPMIAAKLRLTVLGFARDVQVRLAGADVRAEQEPPRVQLRAGGADYGSMFGDLVVRIPEDVRRLRAEGYQVHRPLVFIVACDAPADGEGWHDLHARLVDRTQTPAAPNIIACGAGDSVRNTMARVATRPEFAFIARQGADLGSAVVEFMMAIMLSLTASGVTMRGPSPQLVVSRPDQFTMAIDEV